MDYTSDARVGYVSGRACVFCVYSNSDASVSYDCYVARVNQILTIYNACVDPHFFREEKIRRKKQISRVSKLKEQPQIHMTSKNKIEYIGATISYDKIIMKPKTFLKTRHVLSRIKIKIDGGYRLNSYDAKRILTYTARTRFFNMYNFVSSYDFDRGKLKRIISHEDSLKKLSQ